MGLRCKLLGHQWFVQQDFNGEFGEWYTRRSPSEWCPKCGITKGDLRKKQNKQDNGEDK